MRTVTFLDEAADDRLALVDAASGAALTHGALRERGAALLAPVAARPGLLLLLASNNLFSVLALAGALRGGHPVALVNQRVTAERLQAMVETYRPTWVAGPPDTTARLAELGATTVDERPVEGGALVRLPDDDPPALHPDLALLLATSGVAPSHRFVRLSASNLDAHARALATALGITSDERPITTQPIHTAFGLSVLTSHWAAGAAVVLTDQSVLQPSFWASVEEHRCTSLATVPFGVQLLERTGFRDRHVSTLTTVQQSGGALEPALVQAYDEHLRPHGGGLRALYGQTEATGPVTVTPADRPVDDTVGSVGTAIPGSTVEDDGTGRLVLRGPSVMLGHATTAEDLARGDDLGGVLPTGDLGRVDADGTVRLDGRSSRAAKLFGERLDVDDVERELARRGPAAVLGGSDVVWAFRAYDGQGAIEEEAYRLAKHYGVHPRAFHLTRVDAIPTTPSGEVDHAAVARWVG